VNVYHCTAKYYNEEIRFWVQAMSLKEAHQKANEQLWDVWQNDINTSSNITLAIHEGHTVDPMIGPTVDPDKTKESQGDTITNERPGTTKTEKQEIQSSQDVATKSSNPSNT